MPTEKDYEKSSVLSGFSFSSLFLALVMYGAVLYSIYGVVDGDFSEFQWVIPLAVTASVLTMLGLSFSIISMKKAFIGDTVVMMVAALLAFLTTTGVTLFTIFRILGIE